MVWSRLQRGTGPDIFVYRTRKQTDYIGAVYRVTPREPKQKGKLTNSRSFEILKSLWLKKCTIGTPEWITYINGNSIHHNVCLSRCKVLTAQRWI